MEGQWVDQTYLTALQQGAALSELEPELQVIIRSEWVSGDEVKVVVSEYCDGQRAQYLHFRLAGTGDHLVYSGASLGGCAFDLARIEQMRLGYTVEAGDTSLWYGVVEIDDQYRQQVQLGRDPVPAAHYDWQCGMQDQLVQLLTEGQYQLYTGEGYPIAVEEAFGSEQILEDLPFMAAHSNLMAGYEELCIQAPFDVVLLGSLHPAGELHIYGIEWETEKVMLYETHLRPEADAWGYQALRRGSLRLVLKPGQVLPEGF